MLPVFLLGLHSSMKQHQLLGLPGSPWAARGSLLHGSVSGAARGDSFSEPLLQLPLGSLLSSSSCTAVTFGPCWNLFVPEILQPHCHPWGRDTLCNFKYRTLMCNPENPCSPYRHITTEWDQETKFVFSTVSGQG